jgi:hypothetical protein
MAQSIQVKKIGWWHERLADWMVANPEKQLGDAAKHFDCTRAWLSIVKNSDCFKIYWATRSGDFSNALNDKAVDTIMGVKEKVGAVTELALDEIARRLDTQGEVMSTDTLLDITSMGVKSLGYGAKASTPSPTVNVNVGLVSSEALAKARERAQMTFGLKTEEPAKPAKPPIDASYTEILED